MFCHVALRGILYYTLGIGLSSVIFFPSVLAFLSSGRSGYLNYNPSSYTLAYFRARLLRFIAPSSSVSWSYPALAAIVLSALVLLYCSKRRFALKALAAIAVLTWLSSIGGFIMNGFQYSINRWIFWLALLMAYIVVEMIFLATTLLVLIMPMQEQINGTRSCYNGRNFRAIICLLLVVINVGVNGIYASVSD